MYVVQSKILGCEKGLDPMTELHQGTFFFDFNVHSGSREGATLVDGPLSCQSCQHASDVGCMIGIRQSR